jgi:hypothetical protein
VRRAPAETAWNNHAVDLVRASRAHCMYILLSNFQDAVRALPAGPMRDALKALCDLFALAHLEQTMGDLAEDGCVPREPPEAVRQC